MNTALCTAASAAAGRLRSVASLVVSDGVVVLPGCDRSMILPSGVRDANSRRPAVQPVPALRRDASVVNLGQTSHGRMARIARAGWPPGSDRQEHCRSPRCRPGRAVGAQCDQRPMPRHMSVRRGTIRPPGRRGRHALASSDGAQSGQLGSPNKVPYWYRATSTKSRPVCPEESYTRVA
jgi:hypothetical protein